MSLSQKLSQAVVNAVSPVIESATQSPTKGSTRTPGPAEWTYKRLGKYVYDFESALDNDHEVGARLGSCAGAITLHMEELGYWGPDIITFTGVTDSGERLQVIQNIAQLNVALVTVKKRGEQPRRVGFKDA